MNEYQQPKILNIQYLKTLLLIEIFFHDVLLLNIKKIVRTKTNTKEKLSSIKFCLFHIVIVSVKCNNVLITMAGIYQVLTNQNYRAATELRLINRKVRFIKGRMSNILISLFQKWNFAKYLSLEFIYSFFLFFKYT